MRPAPKMIRVFLEAISEVDDRTAIMPRLSRFFAMGIMIPLGD
ncbi:MAG: hypothetical protein QW057_06135 [Candidatus Bathyarchaeia archaeon]